MCNTFGIFRVCITMLPIKIDGAQLPRYLFLVIIFNRIKYIKSRFINVQYRNMENVTLRFLKLQHAYCYTYGLYITYIIGQYNSSARITIQLLMPLMLCELIFIHEQWELQCNADSELQMFEKPFITILFALTIFARNLLRVSRRRNIFSYLRLVGVV